MKISELAHRTNTSVRSLRYYETKCLLSSHRLANGYRAYDNAAIERVRNIQFYLRLGLTAQQIFSIMSCGRSDRVPSPFDERDYPHCAEAIDLYQAKLAEIEKQIASLEQAKTYLNQRLNLFKTTEKPHAPLGCEA